MLLEEQTYILKLRKVGQETDVSGSYGATVAHPTHEGRVLPGVLVTVPF